MKQFNIHARHPGGCRVIHLSSALALVIPPRERDKEAPARIDEIVLTLDGSVLAEAAIPHAAFLAKTFHAPVHVLQAVYLEETWWGGLGQDELNEPIADTKKYVTKYVDNVAQQALPRAATLHCSAWRRTEKPVPTLRN